MFEVRKQVEHSKLLEDFIGEAIKSDDYYDLLADKLDSMPITRAAAEEILSSIISYDEPSLYIVLLQEYEGILTDHEIEAIKQRYRKTFDLPLETYGIGV